MTSCERAIHRAAWQRCLLLARGRLEQSQQEAYDYWTPAWERKAVAEAEVERDRRRALAHARELAAIERKPVEREVSQFETSHIRRVK